MIMVALKSMALSAICGAFLSAVTVGAASAGSSSAANPVARDCIKVCNDAEDVCRGKAGKRPHGRMACARHYTNCIGNCKF
jgi:hypothetical protein